VAHNTNCKRCDDPILPVGRRAISPLCLDCGEDDAKARAKRRTVAPMHKSNYMLFTDPEDLKGINNKGGLVR
jgi:hypothetical protein